MKDCIMYFLSENRSQSICFFNVCTTVGSQLDAFISLLCFYSVFTQWPFKNIWRLSIPSKTHSGNNLRFICQKKDKPFFWALTVRRTNGATSNVNTIWSQECCRWYWTESLRIEKKPHRFLANSGVSRSCAMALFLLLSSVNKKCVL